MIDIFIVGGIVPTDAYFIAIEWIGSMLHDWSFTVCFGITVKKKKKNTNANKIKLTTSVRGILNVCPLNVFRCGLATGERDGGNKTIPTCSTT